MEEQNQNEIKEPIKIVNANNVLNWLNSFLGIVKNYGISKIIIGSLLLAVVCIFFYLMFNPSKAFEMYDSWKEQKHDDLIELRMENAPKIQSLIDKLTMKVDASRVLILEMHNGNFGNGGLPFTKATATYEGLNIGVAPIAEQYADANLSLMPFSTYLLTNGYVYGSVELVKDIDKGLYYKMKSNGTEHFAACTISGIDKPLAFMFVSYMHPADSTHVCETTREYIRHVAMEVAVLLEINRQLGKHPTK